MSEAIRWRDRLATRLGAAFTGTALVAVLIGSLSALSTTRAGVDRLADDARAAVVADVAAALAAAYEAAGGWDRADLLPAHALAASAGATLVVTTAAATVLPVPADVEDLQRRLQQRSTDTSGPTTGPPATDPPPRPSSEDVPESGGAPSSAPSPALPSPAPSGTPLRRGDDGPTPAGSPNRSSERPTPSGSPSTAGPPGGERSPAAGGTPSAFAAVSLQVEAEPPVTIDDERSAAIVVDGREVGTATLLFVRQDRPGPLEAFARELTRNLLVAGAVAAVLGAAVAGWVGRRLARPLRRLAHAVERLAGGDRGARTELAPAVGELGVLVRSVNDMAAELERQDALRRALVADVAHELRTPLTVLLGEVEALEDGVVTADPTRLASLHEEILRLARLVEDLDAIAAAEAAGTQLLREPIDLATVAASALAGLDELLAAAGVSIEPDLTSVTVRGDRRRLEQVVRNLLTNAAKFSPPGGHVSLVVRRDGAEAVLEVTDDGPGIPVEELGHVFERFWRGRSATGKPGSGVGLAVVAELAAAHGGRVVASNVPGRGARLTVRLAVDATVPVRAGRAPSGAGSAVLG